MPEPKRLTASDMLVAVITATARNYVEFIRENADEPGFNQYSQSAYALLEELAGEEIWREDD
jgi:hypothetical protein